MAEERKVTKDQLKKVGLTTGPKGLNQYLNKWNETGRRPKSADFGSEREAKQMPARLKSKEKLLGWSDWHEQAPQDKLGRFLGPLDPDIWSAFTKADVKKHGLIGAFPGHKFFKEQGWMDDDETKEERIDRVVRQAIKNRRLEEAKLKNRRKVRELVKRNPSLLKDTYGLKLKNGGMVKNKVKKKKGLGTKWENKWN